jgi:hypothetical protein
MVALRLIRLIENHSEQIARNLAARIRVSLRTQDMQKVPEAELITGVQELLQHLSEWLLTKTDADVETRYRQSGIRLAEQGIALADACWAVTMTKEQLWEFLQKQGLLRSPIELYGEMELLTLLNQFFDRALCHLIEGYAEKLPGKPAEASHPKRHREFHPAAFVP